MSDAAPAPTDGQWATVFFDRMIAEANARGMSLPTMIRVLAGIAGNLIACNVEAQEHAEWLAQVRQWAGESCANEMARMMAQPKQ